MYFTFYDFGRRTFSTKNQDAPRNDKTLYLYVLHFYMPKIVLQTPNDHNLGLWIYNVGIVWKTKQRIQNYASKILNLEGGHTMSES